MLMEAQKHGIHWASQLWDGQAARWKEMEEREGGEMERRIRAQWREVLEGEGGRVQPHWDPARHGEKGNIATTVAVEIHTQTGVRADRSTEYSFGHAAPILRNESSNIVWASDGSLKPKTGRAGLAAYPVQNGNGCCVARVIGKQSIPKAELVGGWAQLKLSWEDLKQNPDKVFHGFLDNESMFKMLRKAPGLTDRTLKRAEQGGLYLREVRYMMRELRPDQVRWHWMKSHTERGGPLHEGHNRCDEMAGEATGWDDTAAPRLVLWDWGRVLVGKDGQRIESDPRREIRRQMTRWYWKQKGGLEGTAARALRAMDNEQTQALKEVMGEKGRGKDKKEWINGIRRKHGLRSEWEESESWACRLCGEGCRHHQQNGEKAVACLAESGGCRIHKGKCRIQRGSCNKCKETVQHTQAGCIPSLQKLVHANQEEVAEELRNLVKAKEWDRLEWKELRGIGELGQGEEGDR
jgi:hypothetical protein